MATVLDVMMQRKREREGKQNNRSVCSLAPQEPVKELYTACIPLCDLSVSNEATLQCSPFN